MSCVRIERIQNGYTVAMDDPEIVKANRAPSKPGGAYKPYRDPRKEYAFTDVAGVMGFLEKNLDKALPVDDYSSSFDTAVAEDDD